MEVNESYELPFEHEYDWRVTLFSQYKDLAIQAAVEIVQKLDEKACSFNWKEDIEILNFALKQNIITNINKRIISQVLSLTK